jgi:hypothetical protein
MKLKRNLEQRIRGWLPQSSVLSRAHETENPRWWRPLWVVTVLGIIASGIIFFFVFHAPLERLTLGFF